MSHVSKAFLRGLLEDYEQALSTAESRNDAAMSTAIQSRVADVKAWLSDYKSSKMDNIPKWNDKPWGNNHLVTFGGNAPRMSSTPDRNPFIGGYVRFELKTTEPVESRREVEVEAGVNDEAKAKMPLLPSYQTLSEAARMKSGRETERHTTAGETKKQTAKDTEKTLVGSDRGRYITTNDTVKYTTGKETSKHTTSGGKDTAKLTSRNETAKYTTGRDTSKLVTGNDAAKLTSGRDTAKQTSKDTTRLTAGKDTMKHTSKDTAKLTSGASTTKLTSKDTRKDIAKQTSKDTSRFTTGKDTAKLTSSNSTTKSAPVMSTSKHSTISTKLAKQTSPGDLRVATLIKAANSKNTSSSSSRLKDLISNKVIGKELVLAKPQHGTSASKSTSKDISKNTSKKTLKETSKSGTQTTTKHTASTSTTPKASSLTAKTISTVRKTTESSKPKQAAKEKLSTVKSCCSNHSCASSCVRVNRPACGHACVGSCVHTLQVVHTPQIIMPMFTGMPVVMGHCNGCKASGGCHHH